LSAWKIIFPTGRIFIKIVIFASCKNIYRSSNKTPNQMQRLVVKFIAESHTCCSTCFGHHCAHHQELFQTAVAASGFLINAEVDVFPAVVKTDHGWKHIHLGI
jgi:hypothetical protein